MLTKPLSCLFSLTSKATHMRISLSNVLCLYVFFNIDSTLN